MNLTGNKCCRNKYSETFRDGKQDGKVVAQFHYKIGWHFFELMSTIMLMLSVDHTSSWGVIAKESASCINNH